MSKNTTTSSLYLTIYADRFPTSKASSSTKNTTAAKSSDKGSSHPENGNAFDLKPESGSGSDDFTLTARFDQLVPFPSHWHHDELYDSFEFTYRQHFEAYSEANTTRIVADWEKRGGTEEPLLEPLLAICRERRKDLLKSSGRILNTRSSRGVGSRW